VSEFGGIQNDGTFEPVATLESAAGGPDVEPTNITRGAALATLLRFDSRTVVAPILGQLSELGFSTDAVGQLSDERRLGEALGGGWMNGLNLDIFAPEERQRSWTALNQNADPFSAIQFLIGLLGSPSERESAVGAAALWRVLSQRDDRGRWIVATDFGGGVRAGILDGEWNPELWAELWVSTLGGDLGGVVADEDDLRALSLLVTIRLRAAARSPDPVVRSMVHAVRQADANLIGSGASAPAGSSYLTPPGSLVISMMVHGTWGWRGDWWRPKAAFHKYIATNHRKNLYGRGAHFSWSGAYSQNQRIQAAEDLVDWAGEVSPNGLQTVFAHSYGGEVAAMAAMAGATTQELTMLSVPATGFVNAAAASVKRIIDIRTKGDIVLFIAGTPQPITPGPNVTPVVLPWMLRGHESTHDASTWAAQNVAYQAGL
jgi:hypothetical protein